MIKCLTKDRFNEQCRCSSIYENGKVKENNYKETNYEKNMATKNIRKYMLKK